MVLIILSLNYIIAQGFDKIYLNNPNYKRTLQMHKNYKIKQADIIFLGNSITHGTNWNELLGRSNVVERAIPGDILQGFLARVKTITDLKPKICFVMGGVNDIFAGLQFDFILKDYYKLIRILKRNKIKVVIQAVVYAGKNYPNSGIKNLEIKKFNLKLHNYSEKNNFDFIDLNPVLCKDGFLKNKYTIDGIHFNWRAYKIWAKKIERVLKKYNL